MDGTHAPLATRANLQAMAEDDPVASLAEAIREAVVECAIATHEDARLQGLCFEGAWEAALSAMRALDVASIAQAPRTPRSRSRILDRE